MSGKTLWCSVTGSDGIQTKKTAEIHGEGKAYLRSLSQCLSVMQAEVNEVLTEQVEKARAAQGAGSAATTCTARGASDIEGICC